MAATPETIHWVPVGDRLPDDDTTVLLYLPTYDEPVWFGWCSDSRWYLVDGSEAQRGAVDSWAEMPAGPS